MADIEEVVPAATEEEVVETAQVEEPTTDDPLKTELEKVQRKGRTKAEKLLYTKKRVDEQLKELGIEDEPLEEDDDQPVTLGMLKKMQAKTTTESALQMAAKVKDPTERALLEYHLENTIKSTGDAAEDLKLAQNQVNAVKNEQILEEIVRKPEVNTHSSASGAPPKNAKREEELTPTELDFMRPPFNLTKEQIIAARPKA